MIYSAARRWMNNKKSAMFIFTFLSMLTIVSCGVLRNGSEISLPLKDRMDAVLTAKIDTTELNAIVKEYIDEVVAAVVMAALDKTEEEIKSRLVHESNRKVTEMMKSELDKIDNRITNEIQVRGATYVRWSRKQCPSHAEIVYSGYAGGGRYIEQGSSAEPVCLPPDPDFNKTTAGDYGRMYGAEFVHNSFASDSNYQDVPCAVCRVSQASSTIMIPGKNRCYSGWRMEYHGYLASNHYADVAAGSFVCIDIEPEYVAGGSSWSSESKLFYPVVAKCGSLKCPPYKLDHPLTCVVCSK